MGNFILQIWRYLINMYTFSFTIMFLWAHAKITMFWGVTLPQNIGETCHVCNKKVQSFSHTIHCKNCLMKHHTKCININETEVMCELWYCPYCVQTSFPFKYFEDDNDDDFYSAVIEGMLDCSFRLQEINNKIFTPFEINNSLTPPLLILILTISTTQIFIKMVT